MALVKFLTKQSLTAPVITDFYHKLIGSFGSFFPVEYSPTSTEYDIRHETSNTWSLYVEDFIINFLRELNVSNKNIIDIEFNIFPHLLKKLDVSDNMLRSSQLDALLIYLATANDIGSFILAADLDITGNLELRTTISQDAVDILLSRDWNILEDIVLPTPAPTPAITPTPTATGNYISCNTRITQIFFGTKHHVAFIDYNRTVQVLLHYDAYTAPDRFTLVQGDRSVTTGFVGSTAFDEELKQRGLTPVIGPGKGTLKFDIKGTDLLYIITDSPLPNNSHLEFTLECVAIPLVDTVAGAGVPADFGGNVSSNRCSINLPTSTPTPTPSYRESSIVITIGGSGKSGDKDGKTCLTSSSESKTKPQVDTVAGCKLSLPTPTPTITPTNRRKNSNITVQTIGGQFWGGKAGDREGTELNKDPFPTPTPTPTSRQKITSGDAVLTPDPDITPSTTPTSTLTPTPTLTPSTTCTPTLTPTTTPTCTPSVHCVVSKPKKEEPCCKEPAIVQGHGSTTFNSQITSYVKLLNRCKSALGYPLIQLEITDEQIYNFIDVSLEFFTKFGGYTEEYLIFKSTLYRRGIGLPIGDLFSITPELANSLEPGCSLYVDTSLGRDIDMDDRRKVMDVFTVQPGDNSGINTLFTIEQTIAQQAYFGHLLGNVGFDLITFDVLKIWLKTREKVLALKPSYRFYPEKQLLRITPEPIQTTPYYGIIGAYVQKPIRELISQLWIYKYTMAQIKVTMGHIRGKYAGTGLYGGQTVNYTDLMSQGLKEMEELEKEIKSDLIDREPIPFFLG